MQKYYLLFWLLLPLPLTAQPIAVMSDKIKRIYLGVPNDLTIVVSDVPPERLVVFVSQGTMEAVDVSQGKYRWTICDRKIDWQHFDWRRPPDWLLLADSSLDHPIDTFFFKIAHPDDIRFKTPSGGWQNSTELVAYVDAYGLEDIRPQVLGFDATLLLHGEEPIVLHNEGGIFAEELSGYLKNLLPGEQAQFYNIVCKAGCYPYLYDNYLDPLIKIKAD